MTSDGSLGKAKNPSVAFMTRFRVSMVSFGSTETSVVHAFRASACTNLLEREMVSASSKEMSHGTDS
jgi:hypothetical protein